MDRRDEQLRERIAADAYDAGVREMALAADAFRRLGSPDGSFQMTARAWWARGTAR